MDTEITAATVHTSGQTRALCQHGECGRRATVHLFNGEWCEDHQPTRNAGYVDFYAPTPPAPTAKIATRRAGGLQAGTVEVGDDLTVYYSYATAIGFLIAGEFPVFTDAYYSVRTEAHAEGFGIRDKGTTVLPDPDFRARMAAALVERGAGSPSSDPTRRDFTGNRETSFPRSPFFGGKPFRGQKPRTGQYVYVVRDYQDDAGCDTSAHPYRVKAIYHGIVKADDPQKGWIKGQRMIRPISQSWGEPTEAAADRDCQTEGGYQAFPTD